MIRQVSVSCLLIILLLALANAPISWGQETLVKGQPLPNGASRRTPGHYSPESGFIIVAVFSSGTPFDAAYKYLTWLFLDQLTAFHIPFHIVIEVP